MKDQENIWEKERNYKSVLVKKKYRNKKNVIQRKRIRCAKSKIG